MTAASDWIFERLRGFGTATAIARGSHTASYADLIDVLPGIAEWLDDSGIEEGTRCALIGDYGILSTGLLLELIRRRAITIPMTAETTKRRAELLEICAAEYYIEVPEDTTLDSLSVTPSHTSAAPSATHRLYSEIRKRQTPGLVLFTSGSTGEPKSVVHDFSLLLEKFKTPGRPMRTVNLLLFDHWGGLNTLFYTLTSGGLVACPETRNADHICALIEAHRLELLPASPSFLNMMLVSGAHTRHDLSSLRLITYGAEPMPEATLRRLNRALPDVETRQTYGLIELGVMRAKSAATDSLLVKIGGEGYDVRVVDGLLEIKARSSMLGYLNAPDPFTDDGYFRTGDRVEVHGEYLRILGRESEQINVGGEKVFPAEVEGVLLECSEVGDAVVYGQAHPLSGQVVCADVVRVESGAGDAAVRTTIRKFCNQRLERYKVPLKIRFVDGPLAGERQKRIRIGREVASSESG